MYYAHTNDKNEKQTLSDHLHQTSALAKSFSLPSFQDIAYLAGLLHDIGKYQASFQKRILGISKSKVEHAFCGAQQCRNSKVVV